MAKITGYKAVDEAGSAVPCDSHGNNVAFLCGDCHGPVLAVVRPHQRGSSASNPAKCAACGAKYWVSADESRQLLAIHRVR